MNIIVCWLVFYIKTKEIFQIVWLSRKKNIILCFNSLRLLKSKMEKIALVVIAYNRVTSLKRLLKSLDGAYYDGEENVPLIISIDKSNTDKVERFADEFVWKHGEKTVIKHQQNLGLKQHVLSQGKWLEEFDAIVVLEDDIVVARDFWYYVRRCVSEYQNMDEIAGISLYSFSVNYHSRHPFIPLHKGDNDVYFMNCAMSWGQVWMRKSWRKFYDWYLEHSDFVATPALPESICSWGDKSWLKYHTRYCIEENKYFVFPYVSYTTNFSDCGTHMSASDTIYQVPLLQGKKRNLCLPNLKATDAVLYDGFFENKSLYDALGLGPSQCCLDLSETHGNREHNRFWLTTRQLPYKVLRQWPLEMRPVELNVLLDIENGNGIYLYDTTIAAQRPSEVKGYPAYLVQYLVQNSFLFIREYGYWNVVRDFMAVLKDKIKMTLKK